jgi:hypothetical protein
LLAARSFGLLPSPITSNHNNNNSNNNNSPSATSPALAGEKKHHPTLQHTVGWLADVSPPNPPYNSGNTQETATITSKNKNKMKRKQI